MCCHFHKTLLMFFNSIFKNNLYDQIYTHCVSLNQLHLIKTSFIAYIHAKLVLIGVLCATILTDQISCLEVEE